MAILDQFGRPYEKEIVRERGGRAYAFKEPDQWQASVATGIDPTRLAEILRKNDRGENQDMLTLAMEMPERDLHYFGQLQTRANAIAFVPIELEVAKKHKKSAKARKIAEEATEVFIDNPLFRGLLQDLMDAINVGYQVIQPVWDTTTRPWTFKSFEWIDPRVFQFDVKHHKELRIRDENKENGRPIPPGLYLVHFPRIRAGVRLRASIARLAAVNWFFKTSSVKDWLAFAEVYGMPIRIGKYGPSATEDEIATLSHALINLGHDASAMIPDGMKIEVVDARRPTSGDNVFSGITKYFDEQTSRAVLGQVLASDARATGLGTAIADLHRDVRQDIREADSIAVRGTIDYLLKQWTELNYGVGAPVPKLRIDIDPPEDVQKFTQGVLPWFVQGGLKFQKRWLYRKLQAPLDEGDDGEEMIAAPLAPGTPGAGAPLPGQKSTKKTGAQK